MSSGPRVGVAGKKYGLTIRKGKGALSGRKRSANLISTSEPLRAVFGGDDDSGDTTPKSQEEVNRLLAAGGDGTGFATLRQRRKQKELEDVLMVDESAYEYDTLYDSFQESRAQEAQAHQEKKRQRKSRYVADLLKHAEFREKEQNIIYERRLLKERKKEDDLYGDKESFITSAYKEKLLEDELWKKQQAEKDALDEATSAKALADKSGGLGMSAFHSNMLKTGGHSRSSLVDSQRKVAEEQKKMKAGQVRREREDFFSARRSSSSRASSGRGGPTQSREEFSSRSSSQSHPRSDPDGREVHATTRSVDQDAAASSADKASRPSAKADAQKQTKEPIAPPSEIELEAARHAREDRAKAARERFLARRKANEAKEKKTNK